MPQALAVVTLNKRSGVPQDAVQNSFAFACVTLGSADFTSIQDQLEEFYNETAVGSTAPVMAYLSQSLVGGSSMGGKLEIYDITGHLNGSPHGSPVSTTNFTTGATGSGTMADQLCICLSFHSNYGTDVEFSGSTRPRARDRGRVFLGPLAAFATAGSEDSTTHESYVKSTAYNDISRSAARLMGDPGCTWSVWSRAKSSLDEVVGGWVDNRLDVQRRRANTATFRNVF